MPATQDQMGIRVTGGLQECGATVFIYPEVAVRVRGRPHGIAGHPDAAIRAVLEAHRQGQATHHFPVNLGLGGACANGGPAE